MEDEQGRMDLVGFMQAAKIDEDMLMEADMDDIKAEMDKLGIKGSDAMRLKKEIGDFRTGNMGVDDITFKVLVIGGVGTGKTSLVQRAAKGTFKQNTQATIGKLSLCCSTFSQGPQIRYLPDQTPVHAPAVGLSDSRARASRDPRTPHRDTPSGLAFDVLLHGYAGVDYENLTHQVGGTKVRLKIWDIAGNPDNLSPILTSSRRDCILRWNI